MSKRYGRNQRRKHQEQLSILAGTLYREQCRVVSLEEATRHQAAHIRQLEREIGAMVAVLKPRSSVIPHVDNMEVTAVTELQFTKPSPELRYKIDMERLHILKGPNAVEQLALNIGREIAKGFSRIVK